MRTALFVLTSALVFAQTGSITGKVVDADGGVVAKTPLEATNTQSKAVFKATTSDKGEYTLSAMPAGTYDVAVNAPDFLYHPYLQHDVRVTVGAPLKLDIRLRDGITLNTLGEDRQALSLMFAIPPPPKGATPRLSNGRPDLSGFWFPNFSDFVPADQGGPPPPDLQAWAAEVRKTRKENEYADVPSAHCLPSGFVAMAGTGKFVHTNSVLVVLTEGDLTRQIFLDGRAHPKEVNPTWLGHSTGRWEGDTLVVDTVGMNDRTWLDQEGSPHSDKIHVVERYSRPDLGHLKLELTVEDPGALNKPWKTVHTMLLNPKDDVQEFVCTENNRDIEHLGN
jgi:hypothetical protein